jgi:hypothetical protein
MVAPSRLSAGANAPDRKERLCLLAAGVLGVALAAGCATTTSRPLSLGHGAAMAAFWTVGLWMAAAADRMLLSDARRRRLQTEQKPASWAILVPLVCGTLLLCLGKYTFIWWKGAQFMPALHDEWSYLFGAETFARGRLVNPPPPDPAAFQAIHVLCDGKRWVTRYPPGHPACLALGRLLGAVWLIPTLMTALTGGLLVVWAGRWLEGRVAFWAAALVMASPAFDLFGTCYLSQSSFGFAIALAGLASLQAVRSGQLRWTLLAALSGSAATLIRPFSALVLGLPLLVWGTIRLWQQLGSRPIMGHLGVILSALMLTAVLWCFYNRATTGHFWKTAWQRYNELYEPANTLGFSSPADASSGPPQLASQDWRLVRKAEEIQRQKAVFRWQVALRRSFGSFERFQSYLLGPFSFGATAILVVLVPLLAVLKVFPAAPSAAVPLGLAVLAHYLAFGCFYSTWGVYPLEAAPFLLMLALLGAWKWFAFWEQRRAPLCAMVPVLAIAANLIGAGQELPRWVQRRAEETRYHRELQQLMEELPRKPAILFVRLNPWKPQPYDPIHNDPDLARDVLVAVDQGVEKNLELVRRHFPHRTAYLLLEGPPGRLVLLREAESP